MPGAGAELAEQLRFNARLAESITLLSAAWEPSELRPGPDRRRQLSAEEESIQLYLTQQHCARAVMSQFLDARRDWRWCMEGDELCGVCPRHQVEGRPADLEFHLPRPAVMTEAGEGDEAGDEAPPAVEMEYTGPDEVLRQAKVCDEQLSRYERDLETMAGCCLYCRAEGRPFEYAPTACSRRWHWIRAKTTALQMRKAEKKPWIEDYAACWKCYQPQSICRLADQDAAKAEGLTACRFPDMVMPLCYGAFRRPGRTKWFEKHFGQAFHQVEPYMLWLGGTASRGRAVYLGKLRRGARVSRACVAGSIA